MVLFKSRKWDIRIARQNDWDQVSKISAAIAEEGLVADYITDIGPKYLSLGKTLVIEEDEIIGFHNVQDVPDGSIYLSGMRVAREHRKKGIAMTLLQFALEQAAKDGKKKARAFVEPSNIASRSLLSKTGFSIKRTVHLYFGSLSTDGFTEESEWPDSTLDIGHVPSEYYDGIPAKIFRKGKCLIAVADVNSWDGLPSYTIFNEKGCVYAPGNSFVVSNAELSEGSVHPLRKVEGFESAYLMEKDL